MNQQLEIELPFEYQNSDGYKKALENYEHYDHRGWTPYLCYCKTSKKFYATLFSTREFIETFKQTIIIK